MTITGSSSSSPALPNLLLKRQETQSNDAELNRSLESINILPATPVSLSHSSSNSSTGFIIDEKPTMAQANNNGGGGAGSENDLLVITNYSKNSSTNSFIIYFSVNPNTPSSDISQNKRFSVAFGSSRTPICSAQPNTTTVSNGDYSLSVQIPIKSDVSPSSVPAHLVVLDNQTLKDLATFFVCDYNYDDDNNNINNINNINNGSKNTTSASTNDQPRHQQESSVNLPHPQQLGQSQDIKPDPSAIQQQSSYLPLPGLRNPNSSANPRGHVKTSSSLSTMEDVQMSSNNSSNYRHSPSTSMSQQHSQSQQQPLPGQPGYYEDPMLRPSSSSLPPPQGHPQQQQPQQQPQPPGAGGGGYYYPPQQQQQPQHYHYLGEQPTYYGDQPSQGPPQPPTTSATPSQEWSTAAESSSTQGYAGHYPSLVQGGGVGGAAGLPFAIPPEMQQPQPQSQSQSQVSQQPQPHPQQQPLQPPPQQQRPGYTPMQAQPQQQPQQQQFRGYSPVETLPPPSQGPPPTMGMPMVPVPNNPFPQLVRTTALSQAASSLGSGGLGQPNTEGMIQSPYRASLEIRGNNLNSMTQNWTMPEWQAKRRLVQYQRYQNGPLIIVDFSPLDPDQYNSNIHCISCILWEERNEYFVTSVDCISLLEALVNTQFSVEEKNRIRRNLEGYHPLTVTKSDLDSRNFFRLIMSFTSPKPRRIEKSIKIFKWSLLSRALQKIVSKYSADYSRSYYPLPPPPPPPPMHLSHPSFHQPLPGAFNLPPPQMAQYLPPPHQQQQQQPHHHNQQQQQQQQQPPPPQQQQHHQQSPLQPHHRSPQHPAAPPPPSA